MKPDPIVEEVRRVRKEHTARYGNDIHRIFEAIREKEKTSGHKPVNFGPKKLSDQKNLCVAEEPGDEYKTNSSKQSG